MNRRLHFFALPALALLLLAGCGSSNHLHEYDFADARVAVVANIPPRPIIISNRYYDTYIVPEDIFGTLFRAGSGLAKHAQARKAQARMDSALAYIDVADRVARQALAHSAATLGYRPVPTPAQADYILDLRIESYGLVADTWEAALHFEVDAEMRLIDRRTRRMIWRKPIHATERVAEAGIALGATFGNTYTAVALSKLSVEEMVETLEVLADFTADLLAGALRHDFYASR